jgi:hypothetical protein
MARPSAATPPIDSHYPVIGRDDDILLLDHAEERMEERDIDMFDIRRILLTGDIVGPIESGIGDQEWKCKVVASPRYPESSREIGVVAIVVRTSRLIIKTVEWEDET